LEYTIDDKFIISSYKSIIDKFKSNDDSKDIGHEIDNENELLLKIHCIALFMKNILNESGRYRNNTNGISKQSLRHRHKYNIYDNTDDLLSNIPLSNSSNPERNTHTMVNQPNLLYDNQVQKSNTFNSYEDIIKGLKEIDSLIDVDELKTFSLSTEVILFIENNLSPFLSLQLRKHHQSFVPYQNFIQKVF